MPWPVSPLPEPPLPEFLMSQIEALLAGDRLALTRVLSQVENDTPDGRRALDELFAHTGHAYLIGVTGASGTGKSSLVNHLAYYYRHPPTGEEPMRVAIVAVDPSSPFTGGALLGDRIRMRDLSGDPGVFIRSMAARGSLGGLAGTTSALVQVFDAAGFDLIMVETVGAGQSEVDIARLAHTTLVVEAPGMGDDIQAIKAGILEIADVLVVNKADHLGVDGTVSALRAMLDLAHPTPHIFHHHGHLEILAEDFVDVKDQALWVPPILRTVATEGKGIADLATAIADHRQHLQQSGDLARRERFRLQSELENLLQATLVSRWREVTSAQTYRTVLDELTARRISPHQAVAQLINGDNPR
jgi:LAO/AO transport system kinase